VDGAYEPHGRADGAEDSRLTLTLNRLAFTMTIGGTVSNYDEALAMLELAKNEIKMHRRGQHIALSSSIVARVSRLFVTVRDGH
jgi:hypothetical protein